MSLDDLNRLVTNAILRAESLPAGSGEAREAFHEVSVLEESIARLVAPGDLEGEIARLGAVTAALRASEPLRALQLAERFLAESLADEVAGRLRGLAREAEAEFLRTVMAGVERTSLIILGLSALVASCVAVLVMAVTERSIAVVVVAGGAAIATSYLATQCASRRHERILKGMLRRPRGDTGVNPCASPTTDPRPEASPNSCTWATTRRSRTP